MRRPRKFLSLIVILLVINALFFTIWYPLGGRDALRRFITDTISNAADIELSFGDLNLSDRQIFAQDVHFAMADSLVSLQAESIRIRYNLYKFLFSGFKPEGVVSSVEVIKPVAAVRYHHTPKEKEYKPKKDFSFPDLSGYFERISLIDGQVSADIRLPLKIVQQSDLVIEESLKELCFSAENIEGISSIKLSAISSLGGEIDFEGSMDRGRIDLAQAHIHDFRPLYIHHPDIMDFRTEISASASYSEPTDSSAARYTANALLWDSSAYMIERYPVSIPRINAETNGDYLKVDIPGASISQSNIQALLMIEDLMGKMRIDGSNASLTLNMNDIMPQMSGIVTADLLAEGSFTEPVASLVANSTRVAYQDWAFEDLVLSAAYKDELATLNLPMGRWDNQYLNLEASFAPFSKALSAELYTSPVSRLDQDIIAEGRIQLDGLILAPYPMLEARLDDIDISYNDLSLRRLNGSARMTPLDESLLFDADLSAENGFVLSAVGDILDQHIALDGSFADLDVAELYGNQVLEILKPRISGNLSAIMMKDKIWLRTNLDTALEGEYEYDAEIDMIASVDLLDLGVTASLNTQNASLFGEDLNLDLTMSYKDDIIKVTSFQAEDFLSFSGRMNLKDWQDSDFDLSIFDLDTSRLLRYYSELELIVPDFQRLNLFARYNRNQDGKLSANLNLNQLDLISIIPINVNLNLLGDLDQIMIDGDINAQNRKLVTLSGETSILPAINLRMQAMLDDLRIQDLLFESPGEATLSGSASFAVNNALKDDRVIEFGLDMRAKDLLFADFKINQLVVKAEQLAEALVIDTLYAQSPGLFEAKARGSLDFNVLSNLFYEGDRAIDLVLTGELFPWLMTLTDYVQESRGSSTISLKISTDDEQFSVLSGELDINSGYIRLKDQVEPMRDIRFQGIFEDNRFVINHGSFLMGNGRFYLDNLFDPEPSDHFVLSFLDLGYIRLMIEEPGIQATIPVIAPPRTLTNIALRGQSSRYATIRGPFEDMKIEAHVTASNLDILFPPGADNLLNLIMSVRSTGKKPEADPVPLPFTMDLLVSIGENVRYVTYPTNLHIMPGGFLHLIYDGSRFIVEEANINSERGTIDFFGTVFQVDNIAVSMIDQQGILDVNGMFYKRTPDGSTITLSVYSTPEFDMGIFDRLQLSLESDNPSDQSITQVLSRLRYNQSMDELPDDQKNNLLQDEALGLIGGNLDSSVFTPFFYPVENWIRRKLKLDGFSINAGFIQNLFSEYSSDPSQLADLADMSNFATDITQFSSSILLNNLSINMSKYIGYRMFVDYELMLQEATDLQQKTSILVSHEAALRLVLPKQYRLGYTLSYAPKETKITHEIMLQRSLRFWGL